MLVVLAAPASASSVSRSAARATSSAPAVSYKATGAVKSFGPARAFVNLAHDEIPGFMKAMTMSFHPGSADPLAKLSVGDRVRFELTVTDEGRRVLLWIEERWAPPSARLEEGLRAHQLEAPAASTA